MIPLEERSDIHAALGDPVRLAVVDALALGDLGVEELTKITGVEGNLLAHHLKVLEGARLVERRSSEGDRRRRYVSLRHSRLLDLMDNPVLGARCVLFVCVHNSARSLYAAALWKDRTGYPDLSAGTHPAAAVHPRALEAASELGVDLAGSGPKGYEQIDRRPDLVVSVCDRARESGDRFDAPRLHWSVPDPVSQNTITAFRRSFEEITRRVERLVAATKASAAPIPIQ